MKIDIVCRDGSPLGVSMKSLYGEDGRNGVGGAELALLTMCEAWHKAGHEVTLYNNPKEPGASPFQQRRVTDFIPNNLRDICITFRSPNPMTANANGKKVWWSTDQRTIGDFRQFSSTQDEIVTISPYHSQYFKDTYGIEETTVIDLPVRDDYNEQVDKLEKQVLFSSVPDRGLLILAKLWPRIKERVPDANLVITSGWSLWTGMDDSSLLMPYRMAFRGQKDVEYVGAVRRKELNRIQLQSSVLGYPCIYPELFCYAVAEAQVAGCFPVTSVEGALMTTNMGLKIRGNPKDSEFQDAFVEGVAYALMNPKDNLRQVNHGMAKERFSLERIMKEWENVFSY